MVFYFVQTAPHSTDVFFVFLFPFFVLPPAALPTEQELREKRKLLWSGGQPKKRPKKKKRKKGKVPTVQLTDDDYSATAEGSGGAVGTYRLVVTDDGNAVLKRGDAEVVWKALPK